MREHRGAGGQVMLPSVGTIVDNKFEIRGTIGSGGMGVVYEAYQAGLERVVALKLLTAHPDDDPMDAARFEREALVLSKLSHPNIVQFYAYGLWHMYPYIAMERLCGPSLQQLLSANEPLPTEHALNILSAIAEGLHHAHSTDILHRDIKPSNVILTESEGQPQSVKLIDFGLAKLVSNVPMQKLTQTGMGLGSVLYMSPEQSTGKNVDSRTDIYSFGCLMHHCLTGVPPFSADNAVALLFLHANEPITQADRWDTLAPSHQQVIAKCIAKNPADRYSSALALKRDLALLLKGTSPELEGKPITIETAASRKVARGVQRAPNTSLSTLVVAIAAVIAATVCGVFAFGNLSNKPSVETVEPGAAASRELLYKITHGGLGVTDNKSIDKLYELINLSKNTRYADQDMLLMAYSRVIQYYNSQGYDRNTARRIAGEAIETCTRFSRSRLREYFHIVSQYHMSCRESHCELSVKPLLEKTLAKYPDAPKDVLAHMQFQLASDYIQLRDTAMARKLIAKAAAAAPEDRRAEVMYQHCARIDRENIGRPPAP